MIKQSLETSANSTSESSGPASWGQMLFGQAVLLIFCVGLPSLFTASSPLSVLQLTRQNGGISASVSKRLLFIIPFSHREIEHVTSIGDQFVSGSTGTSSGPGRSRSTTTEDSAYLTLEGAGGPVKVEVSPANIQGVLKKTDAFIADPSQTSLRMTLVANWKFGVFAGGILSLFTLLWIYVESSMLLRWITRR